MEILGDSHPLCYRKSQSGQQQCADGSLVSITIPTRASPCGRFRFRRCLCRIDTIEWNSNVHRAVVIFRQDGGLGVMLRCFGNSRPIVRQHSIELIHSVEHNVYPIVADLAKLCGLPVVVGVHCRIERRFGEWAFGGRRKPDRLFFLSKGSQEVCRAAVDGVVSSARWRLLSNGLNLQELRPDREAGRKFRNCTNLEMDYLLELEPGFAPASRSNI